MDLLLSSGYDSSNSDASSSCDQIGVVDGRSIPCHDVDKGKEKTLKRTQPAGSTTQQTVVMKNSDLDSKGEYLSKGSSTVAQRKKDSGSSGAANKFPTKQSKAKITPKSTHHSAQHAGQDISSMATGEQKVDGKFPKRARLDSLGRNDGPESCKFERSVPHIRGNWAGHVYAPIHPTSSGQAAWALQSAAERVIQRFREKIRRRVSKLGCNDICVVSHVPTSCDTPCGDMMRVVPTPALDSQMCDDDRVSLGLHLSLSKLFFMQRPSIPGFEKDLTRRLSLQRSIAVLLDPNQPEILLNDDGTRSFLTIPAVAGLEGAVGLIQCVDEILSKYKQPTYYKQPKVHVSIASVQGDATLLFNRPEPNCIASRGSNHSEEHLPTQGVDWDADDTNEAEEAEEDRITVLIDHVQCTLGGTKTFSVNLVK